MKIAIVGATGFIGNLLLENLVADEPLVALSRSKPRAETSNQKVERRTCDLFSLLQLETALADVDLAIYLIHSMLPSARLVQSSFENSDLLLADNFARACRRVGVRRVIYLGGLIPPIGKLSRHLQSRREVEHALGSMGAAVTTLRAGLILGEKGSSFQILYTLVKRLPIMICPRWTQSLTQPIAVQDVLKMIQFCVDHPETASRVLDIGGREVLTYQDLMAAVAKAMHRKRYFVTVPLFKPGLSRLWVRLITGASRNLVYPLIDSLRHNMIASENAVVTVAKIDPVPLTVALRQSLDHIHSSLRSATETRVRNLREAKEVRSIQRMILPPGRDAQWVAAEYFRWLPRFLMPVIRVIHPDENTWRFQIPLLNITVLILRYSPERSSPDRQLFYIAGGALARTGTTSRARLEFRQVLEGKYILAAIHDYQPRLPWYLYNVTQAVAHLWVMRGFRAHLKNVQD